MVSSAGNLGMQRISVLARALENAAKSGGADAAKAEGEGLETAFQLTMDEIDNRQPALAATA
jgi:HPt (histidine-containing phosphotransfer) domain-containing protein